MAVTKSSDTNSKQPVEEGVRLSCRDSADAGPSRLIRPKKSDGPKAGEDRDIDKDTCRMAKKCIGKRKRKKENEVDSLSDIDDAEVSGYLNTKEEFQIKRILWELMNGNYTKAKKRKRAEVKKGALVKKTAKTTDKVKTQRPSSRINYDALKMLNDEFDQASEATQMDGTDYNRSDGPVRMHGTTESSYNEDENGTINGKDNGNFDHHDGDMYYEYFDF